MLKVFAEIDGKLGMVYSHPASNSWKGASMTKRQKAFLESSYSLVPGKLRDCVLGALVA